MTIDPRMLGALRKTIVTAAPIVFPVFPQGGMGNTPRTGFTAIIRALTTDVQLSGVILKNDTGAGPYIFTLAAGVELVGATAATVDSGTVEVFFTTGA